MNTIDLKNKKEIERIIAYDGICSSWLIKGEVYLHHLYDKGENFESDIFFKTTRNDIESLKSKEFSFEDFAKRCPEIYIVSHEEGPQKLSQSEKLI